MTLISAVNRFFRMRTASLFVVGVAVGFLSSIIFRFPVSVRFPKTEPPRTIGFLCTQGVSHNPEVLKRVLAARGDIPHIAQVHYDTIQINKFTF